MNSSKPDWKANKDLPVGKGATFQQWVATVGKDKLEMDVAPWGEGHLKVNGREIAFVNDAKDRRQAFRNLNNIAERYLQGQIIPASKTAKSSPMLPVVKAKLLEGKKGLIVGIANENSIAWGCAKAFRAFGADLAVTYLNEKAKKYVEPLARALDAPIVMPLDVNTPGQMEAVFERIAKDWGNLDFVVHSIAFSPKDALQGRVVDVPRDGFLTTMDVSCWTFIRMAHLAEPLMRKGGTLFTMTLLWQSNGGEELQHHGCGQSGTGERRALHGGGARPEGHSRSRHFARTLVDARRFRHPGIRCAAGESEKEGARPQPGQHR